MEARIKEVQPMVAENWVKYNPDIQTNSLIQPVSKTETDSKVKTESDTSSRSRRIETTPEKSRELAEEVRSFLEEMNLDLNFKIHDKTGDLVVQVLNRKTGDVIRQIPPEDLVKLHEKLVELRGVLFEGKV